MISSSLNILLPTCLLLNEPDPLRSTIKTWLIARSSAIFRVDNIYFYNSRRSGECNREASFVRLLLEYFRTPPYLRKKVYPLKKELRYAGLAPPLQIPTHLASSTPVKGEVREGIVVRSTKKTIIVDVGLPSLIEIEKDTKYRKGERVFLEVTGVDPVSFRIISYKKKPVYLGYNVKIVGDLPKFVHSEREKGRTYFIGTSRMGRPAWRNVGSIVDGVIEESNVYVVFGEPYRGLYEIGKEMGFDPDSLFDDVYNFIPGQGTKSVRIEEALFVVLQTIRFLEYQYSI